MSIKCGSCKQAHDSVDEVKACFMEAYDKRREALVPTITMHAACEDTRAKTGVREVQGCIPTQAGSKAGWASINDELQAIVRLPVREEHNEPLPHQPIEGKFTLVGLTEQQVLEVELERLQRADAAEAARLCIGEGMTWMEELQLCNAALTECTARAEKPVKVHPSDKARLDALFGRVKRVCKLGHPVEASVPDSDEMFCPTCLAGWAKEV